MYSEVMVLRQSPIEYPVQFELLCQRAGANTIFHNILSSMTDHRHSGERVVGNEQRAVAIMYKLYYGLSQQGLRSRGGGGAEGHVPSQFF